MTALEAVLRAIERQEGYRTGTRAFKNNNPGNLKYFPFSERMGATGGDDQNHAIFPSVELGRAALRELIVTKYRGKTLKEIGRRYAEDTNWADAVSKISGVSLESVVVEAA